MPRIDAFKLWCWRRLLRVPFTARRSNQSILKEIKPEYALEGLILQQKLQYFHQIQRANSLEKPLMLGKTESRRIRGCQRMRWLASTTHSVVMNFSKLWESGGQRHLWHCSPWGHTTQQLETATASGQGRNTTGFDFLQGKGTCSPAEPRAPRLHTLPCRLHKAVSWSSGP